MKTRRQRLYENSQRNRKIALASYRYGWPIDPVKQAQIADKIRGEITRTTEALGVRIQELIAEEHDEGTRKFLASINLNSGQQLARLLYEVLEEPIAYRTKQGAASTGKGALEHIARHGGEQAREIAALLRQRKIAAKLEEAYIHNLDGVRLVRPAAHVTAQVGGRWSYRDPALQTVPQIIKPMFTAHPGCWMVACDLAGAEYRTMALQAGCVPMLDAFNEGRDLHTETAGVIFGLDPKDVQPSQRKIAKGVGLGFHYSVLDFEGAAAGLFAQVGHLAKGLTFGMILGAIKRLAQARPEIMAFKERLWQRAQVEDYVEEPLFNRRRYFHNKPKDTEAYNFPQQAMIAAIVDQAIQRIDAEFDVGEGLHLQRHDELIIGGPTPLHLCQLLWEHMRQKHTIGEHSIIFEIEFLITKRWGEGVEVVPEVGGGFTVKCPPKACGFKRGGLSLGGAVKAATEHYDACEHMEGVKDDL